jgi:hypothetical protein
MKAISIIVLILFIVVLIVPVLAQETLTNTGTPVYTEPTLSASKTVTKITIVPTAVLTTEPTPIPTTVQTTIVTAVPTSIPTTVAEAQATIKETIVKIKLINKWKDTSPKLSKNKLVFETATPQQISVQDADDKNVTLSVSTSVNNQIDLPVDISKPGRISVKMQVGDVVYVIRREV